MDCRNARELLGAYHDGELAGGDRDRVAAHLERCAECAARLEALRRIDGAVEAPDPGPEYWEGFQRRVDERIAREENASREAVPPRPRPAWARWQLRYLVPAAAAALLAVAVFRNLAPGPVPPVRTEPPAPPAQQERGMAAKAPAPQRVEKKETADRAAGGRRILEERSRAPAAAPAPRPADESAEGRRARSLQVPQRGLAEPRASEPAADGKEAAGVQAPAAAGKAQSAAPVARASAERVAAEKSQEGCGEARRLAGQGRLKEAEAAQRACLARDESPGARERGTVFLAELLDRQHRFAEADAVIAEAQERFPGSERLEAYLQRRSRVQAEAVPVR